LRRKFSSSSQMPLARQQHLRNLRQCTGPLVTQADHSVARTTPSWAPTRRPVATTRLPWFLQNFRGSPRDSCGGPQDLWARPQNFRGRPQRLWVHPELRVRPQEFRGHPGPLWSTQSVWVAAEWPFAPTNIRITTNNKQLMAKQDFIPHSDTAFLTGTTSSKPPSSPSRHLRPGRRRHHPDHQRQHRYSRQSHQHGYHRQRRPPSRRRQKHQRMNANKHAAPWPRASGRTPPTPSPSAASSASKARRTPPT